MPRPTDAHTAATRSLWRGGWLLAARHCPSPNHDPRPAHTAIDLVVVHSISLPPGRYGGNAVRALFLNQLDCNAHPYYESLRGLRVSSHFFITRNGQVWQFVACSERAWHAGLSHYRMRARCNDDSIGIELEGIEDSAFEEAQYTALEQLCDALRRRYPIRYLTGHEHIAPGRKRDPGSAFDWPRISHHLAGSGIVLPPVAPTSR